ncbi:hypothetical protein CMI37_36730 [Candidatus Pacearchaeota archaeon]|nr:hypothetical protein [Candidatus Pacearchaeota archaeon]|tara:strand:+ start:1641 stop:1919 length:279 start_codon:yes stop_codon:yes gene_type:complete
MLTDMWEEDIGHLDPERLKECIRLHRQRSVFFPVCADILEINIELNTRAYDSRPLLLDMDLTPEQIEENKAGLKALKKRFKIKGVSDEHENI